MRSRLTSAPAAVLLGTLTVYRFTLGPLLTGLFGAGCRFHPSCSAYATEAIRTHGAARGARMALKRVARCRPGGGFGYDPVATVTGSPAVEMS